MNSHAHVERVLWHAKLAGDAAAENEVRRIAEYKRNNKNAMLDCGSASIILNIDGRSSLAKTLISLDLPYLLVIHVSNSRCTGYSVSLKYDVNLIEGVSGQEMWIYQSACDAALPIILQGLGVEGYVKINVT